MNDQDKINQLINSEDENNLALAHGLLLGKGFTELEANNKVYGMSLRLVLRLITTTMFQSSTALIYMTNGVDRLKRFKTSSEAYEGIHFYTPRITCMDGFNISIQIGNANYCSSENGYRKLGLHWKTAEWGMTSEYEPLLNNDAEGPNNTTSTCGRSTIELLEQVIDKHGGINWQATLSSEIMNSLIK